MLLRGENGYVNFPTKAWACWAWIIFWESCPKLEHYAVNENSHNYLSLRFLECNCSKPLLLVMTGAAQTPEELHSASSGKYFSGFFVLFLIFFSSSYTCETCVQNLFCLPKICKMEAIKVSTYNLVPYSRRKNMTLK